MNYRNPASALSAPFEKAWPGSASPRAIRDVSEEDIIELVRNGDTEAFGGLVRRYEDFIFTMALGIVKSKEEANDIAQETFLRAYRGIRRFQLRSSFKTWVYRIAYNTAMSHLRKKEREITGEELDRVEPPDKRSEGHYLRITLKKLTGMLKPELRAVVLMHYYDDLKYEEIAEVLECPLGTVKIRLYRAKHELKKLWDKYAVRV